jgi:hypothetical protein
VKQVRNGGMEENCIGSRSPQRTEVLEKKKKKKKKKYLSSNTSLLHLSAQSVNGEKTCKPIDQ